MKTTLCLTLSIAWLWFPGAASAQTLKPDAHVRVWSGAAEPVDGTFVKDEGAVLVLDTFDRNGSYRTVKLPWASVTRLDVDRRPPAIVTGLRCAALGIAIGGVLGLMSGDDSSGFVAFSAEEKALALGALGGAVGGVTGLIVGTRAQWERIDVRPTKSSLPSPAFSLKLRF